jgi:hypothetical protein
MLLAIFDFLVAVTAVFAGIRAYRRNPVDLFTQTGYAAVMVAALIGTVKFAGVTRLAEFHAIASHIAAIIGVPFAAVGFLALKREIRIWAMAAVGLLFIIAAVLLWKSSTYALFVGIFAQILWLWGGVLRRAESSILLRVVISVVLTSLAGLLFAGPGLWHGIERENIFHGLLALALLQQGYAFRVE